MSLLQRSTRCPRSRRLAVAVMVGILAAGPATAAADAALEALESSIRLHGGGKSGTAFLVTLPEGGLLLFSAAHTFENINERTCTAVCRVPTKDGGFARHDLRLTIRDGTKPRWTRHPLADVAALPMSLPEEVAVRPFPLARLATAADFDSGKIRVGQQIRLACFPAQTEANAAGWPVLRTGVIASHPLTPAAKLDRFFVDYQHFGGDSGAAVVTEAAGDGKPLVIGVVVAMQRQTDRTTSPYEETIRHTPLGLAITVPSTRLIEVITTIGRSATAGDTREQ